MSLLSIIIPVYNVEKYLHQCVDSVLQQTFQDYEIILVDDGSIDSSPIICDSYSSKHHNIKTIHKKNGGLSDARNTGIRNAQGEYLLFLDSDDYWRKTDSTQIIFDTINKHKGVDIIVFGASLLYQDGNLVEEARNYPREELKGYDGLYRMISEQLLIGSACTKAVRKQFILDNDLYFKVGIRSEDIEWILRTSAFLPAYKFIDDSFYVYRIGRPGSITSSINIDHLYEYLDIIEDAVKQKNWDKDVKELLLHYVAYQYVILCAHAANLKKSSRKKELQKKLKKYTYLLDYDLNSKVKKVRKVYKIAGFYPMSFMLGKYLKIR